MASWLLLKGTRGIRGVCASINAGEGVSASATSSFFRPRCRMTNASSPRIAIAPTETPTRTPAFLPVERPGEGSDSDNDFGVVVEVVVELEVKLEVEVNSVVVLAVETHAGLTVGVAA